MQALVILVLVFFVNVRDAVEAEQPRFDLEAIQQRGELRILHLARSGTSETEPSAFEAHERDLAETFARELGVAPRWISRSTVEEMRSDLVSGEGDLIVDRVREPDDHELQLARSSAVVVTQERIIGRRGGSAARLADLAGRTVHVERASRYWQIAEELRSEIPSLRIEPLSAAVGAEELLRKIGSGELDLTILSEHALHGLLDERAEVEIGAAIGSPRSLTWAVVPEAIELLVALDRFLTRGASSEEPLSPSEDSLAAIRERGRLRVLTRSSATTYFIDRGEIVGFEYELARAFADELGVEVELVVPPTRAHLVRWLHEGKGDLIAAGLTASEERAMRDRLRFSRPYLYSIPTLVGRAGSTLPRRVEDFAGRTFVVRRSSLYWSLLQQLNPSKNGFKVQAAPEALETEHIIDRVARGEYDLTIANDQSLAVELSWRKDIQSGMALGAEQPHGWAVRRHDVELAEAIDRFLEREYRGVRYNVLRKRYFESSATRERGNRPGSGSALSPYDELVRKHAQRYAFDWRMVVAQMYQESRFDPDAVSGAGARGLLQVLPRTATQLGVHDLRDPETSIEAGVRYLDWLREQLGSVGASSDALWFWLAAYNAGYGHVRDAREIARQQGLNPNLWFDNVERAILLKQEPKVHRTTRHGYCRCSETVRYVRSIRDRYSAYLDVHPFREPPASDVASRELSAAGANEG